MSIFKKNKYPAHLEPELPVGKQLAIFTWEIFKIVVISLAIIVPVRYFLIKPFYVKGASMEPTFQDHQYLIIDEISYRFNEPKRGDVVVFRYPHDPSQFFIKRIMALPGETIKISGGQVLIVSELYPEGLPLKEPYLAPGMQTSGEYLVTLAGDEYFLLGDNRAASLDSRNFGPVRRQVIVGKTLFRGWPLDEIGLITNNISYNL